MTRSIFIRLAAMMFLQFFVWGTWYVTMGTYLFEIGFSGLNVGAAFSTVNWGAILSPFIIGLIADKFFAAEKVMGVIHLTGAALLWYVSTLQSPGAFFWVLLTYSILYMPTLALANAICFHQMERPEKQFPLVRVLGTIGWIAAGLIIGFLAIEKTAIPFRIGAGVSLLLGLYSFFLPNTPPKKKDEQITWKDVVGYEAIILFKNRSFLVFTISSLLISIPLAFYYSFTNPFFNEVGMVNAAGKMTMGQMSEILFLLLMPFFFTRLGVKKMILIAMAAWALRYILFVYGNVEELLWLYYVGIILHGICYDFFFVTGQIYVDNAAPKSLQASAQGLITLLTYGLGMLIGSWTAGWYVSKFTLENGTHNWNAIWWLPAIMSMVILIFFGFMFKDESLKKGKAK